MRIIVRKFTKILKKKNIKIIVREFNFEIDKNKKKKNRFIISIAFIPTKKAFD